MSILNIPEVSDLEISLSTGKHTPPLYLIPAEFRGFNNPWVALFDQIFYKGVNPLELEAKKGIDVMKHLRFFRHCATSFSTSHDHKTAACAWILSETFVSPERKPVREDAR